MRRTLLLSTVLFSTTQLCMAMDRVESCSEALREVFGHSGMSYSARENNTRVEHERAKFEAQLNALTQGMSQSCCSNVKRYLLDVPVADRDKFVADVNQFIPVNHQEFDRMNIIYLLSTIPMDELDGIMRGFKALYPVDMNTNLVMSVRASLLNVKATDRDGLVRDVKQLLTPDMSQGDCANILCALSEIPVDERTPEFILEIKKSVTSQVD